MAGFMDKVKGWFGGAKKQAGELADKAGDKVPDKAKETFETVSDKAKGAYETVSEKVKEKMPGRDDGRAAEKVDVADKVEDAAGGVQHAVDESTDAVADGAGEATDKVTDADRDAAG